jgi:excisionase family DNA binding protein
MIRCKEETWGAFIVLTNKTILPNDKQSESISDIAANLQMQTNAKFFLLCPDGKKIPLPEPLAQVLLMAADALRKKNAITLFVRHSWLTTQEAADIMGYSRQVVVDLIKKSKLKASTLGSHRRISLTDLLEFIETEGRKHSKAIVDLVTQTRSEPAFNPNSRKRKTK